MTPEMHEDFYRFISNAYDKPRYNFHYKTDAPLNIRALFYIPEYKPSEYGFSSFLNQGVRHRLNRGMLAVL